jgi:outer membrane protein TolC
MAGQKPEPASVGFPIDRLIELTLERNEELLAVRTRVQQAEGLLRQAGLRPNPVVDVTAANGAVLGSRGESEYSVGLAHTIETAGGAALHTADNSGNRLGGGK